VPDNQVVNVCFHGIGTPDRELEPGEDRYWVPTDLYHRVLDEVATWPTPVRISFDDGNASDAEIGLPGLVERNLTGDFFVLADRLDRTGSLSLKQVGQLRAAGMTVGSHGMLHRSWRGLDEQGRVAEFVTARDRIADVTGVPVDSAACPLGEYDRQVLSGLREAGYRRVFTSDRRVAAAGDWLQPRYSVRHTDTPESLRTEVFHSAAGHRLRNSAVGLVKRWR
jgi:peptidoglycan/xylan/chitin deacetylase (PgdA/CDA1 family)